MTRVLVGLFLEADMGNRAGEHVARTSPLQGRAASEFVLRRGIHVPARVPAVTTQAARLVS